MKILLGLSLAGVALLTAALQAMSTEQSDSGGGSAREKLIGAWHLVAMEEPGADGKLHRFTDRKGALLYTSDGHMSVQVMYPMAESSLSNEYVRNGYEASFGSYDVDEFGHTVTHHVQGSVTPGLIGKSLPRSFQFSDGHLIIKSTRPDEHWSVTWERNPVGRS